MSILPALESAARSLGDYTVRATLLLLLVGATARVLKRNSSATRHVVWVAAFLGLLTLPFVDLLPPIASHFGATARLAAFQPAPGVSVVSTPPDPVDLRWDLMGTLPGAPSLLPQPAGPGLAGTLVISWSVGWLTLLAGRIATLVQAARAIRGDGLAAPGPRVRGLFAECVPGGSAPQRLRVDLLCCEVTGGHDVEATMGWWRPTILLGHATQSWSDERLRAVFRHELAHIRRGDWLVQQAAWVGCSLLWFHPLAWLGYRALRLEAERAADDAVLRCGVRPSTYSAELMALLQFIQTSKSNKPTISFPMKTSIPMAQPSTIEVRIRAILDRAQNRRGLNGRQVALLVLLALCVMIPLSMVHLQAASASPTFLPNGSPHFLQRIWMPSPRHSAVRASEKARRSSIFTNRLPIKWRRRRRP